MVHEIEHPVAGAIKQLGFVPKLSDTAARVERASPALGEQTDELLAEIGVSEAEREQLYKSGIARRAEAGGREPDAPPLRV